MDDPIATAPGSDTHAALLFIHGKPVARCNQAGLRRVLWWWPSVSTSFEARKAAGRRGLARRLNQLFVFGARIVVGNPQTFARIAISKTFFDGRLPRLAWCSGRRRGFSIEGCDLSVGAWNRLGVPRYSAINGKPVARYNQGRSNKSLDASGGSVFCN